MTARSTHGDAARAPYHVPETRSQLNRLDTLLKSSTRKGQRFAHKDGKVNMWMRRDCLRCTASSLYLFSMSALPPDIAYRRAAHLSRDESGKN